MAKRFTDAQKQAALADLKDGMTLEQAAKKHKCSANSLIQWKKALGASAKAAVKRTPAKNVSSSAISSAQANRLIDLEDENKFLKDENQTLRSLMLDGYIAREQHPQLRQIAQILRDAGGNQLRRIMETILVVEVEASADNESLDRPEATVASNGSNGLPRHPSGIIKLRRKAATEA